MGDLARHSPRFGEISLHSPRLGAINPHSPRFGEIRVGAAVAPGSPRHKPGLVNPDTSKKLDVVRRRDQLRKDFLFNLRRKELSKEHLSAVIRGKTRSNPPVLSIKETPVLQLVEKFDLSNLFSAHKSESAFSGN